MGRKEQPSIIIFSVFQYDQTKEHNLDIHETVKISLSAKNIGYKELLNIYKNHSELSLLVRLEHEEIAKYLCKQFNQDCYMVSGPERDTHLVFKDGSKDFTGTLQRVSEQDAKSLDFCLYDFSDNSFWGVR